VTIDSVERSWPSSADRAQPPRLARQDDPRRARIVSAPRSASLPSAVVGLRLFRWRGRLHATATVRDRNPAMRCEIALVEIDDAARIVDLVVLRGYGDDRHQKNWMPAVDGDALLFVYLCDPTTVLRYEPEARRARLEAVHEPAIALDHLRGGSQLVRFDDGWICLTHEVAMIDAWTAPARSCASTARSTSRRSPSRSASPTSRSSSRRGSRTTRHATRCSRASVCRTRER
jgi:hypothetical protein